MKKIISFILICSISVLMLAGCSGGEKESETINIGSSFALTGDVAVYGKTARNGVEMAIEEYNANGGINGKQISFTCEDNKGDQTEAVNAFNKLKESSDVFIGSDISSTTLAIAANAVAENFPMLTPTATNPEVTKQGENVFRACFLDPFQGTILATLAYEDLGLKNAAVMYNTADDYSVGIANAFKEDFEAKGGTVVNFEGYSKGEKDFSSILTNIKEGNPEVIVIPDYYNTVALITNQIKSAGIDTQLLGVDGWDGVIDVATSPDDIEGAYFVNHYALDDPDKKIQDFIKNYKEKYDAEPNALAALGYDGAVIMIEAIKKAGSTDKEAVIKALNETDINSVTGHIVFDENRNPIKSATIVKIENNKNVLYKKIQP